MQYYDTGKYHILITLLFVAFILGNIYRAKSKQGNLFIRRIAGLNAIEEAIGRATEMGRPVLMVPGLGGLNAISVQALNIFAYVTRIAIKFATPIRVCCGEPAVFTVAQEVIRDVYQKEGASSQFGVESVQFLSDRQFAFAAAVSGLIQREQVAATFLLGEFFAESLIFAESANSVGAIQIAGSTQTTQTPFFIAACDYVLIGDEYYAASAYLSREPILVGSLVGQDWVKIAVACTVFVGAVVTSFERISKTTEHRELSDEGKYEMKPAKGEEFKKDSDTMMFRFINEEKDPTKVDRPKDPDAKKEEGK